MRLFTLCLLLITNSNASSKPNVLVFMADDLGIGDVGCFAGNKTQSITPNIDRLCAEGVKLEHLSTPSSLCTPSRTAFLTARYAHRHGLAGGDAGPRVIIFSSSRAGLPDNATTWAEMLKNHNYTTALFGKWHLGWDRDNRGDHLSGPLSKGFDHFFGLPLSLMDGMDTTDSFFTYNTSKEPGNPLHSHGLALALCFLVVAAVYDPNNGYFILVMALVILSFVWLLVEHLHWHKWLLHNLWWKSSNYLMKLSSSVLISNRSVVEQPINLDLLTQRLTNSTIKFIRQHVNSDKPFGLFFSFSSVHVPLRPQKLFKDKSKRGVYGDTVLEMDASIGRVLALLDELDVAKNTLVLFLSDHGAHIDLRHRGGSNLPFRGGKSMSAREGGVRIPGIVRWPQGGFQSGHKLMTPLSLLDFGPTLAEIIGDNDFYDDERDGRSVLSLLKGGESGQDRLFRHYCGNSLHALRLSTKDGGVFKAVFREPVVNEEGHCGYGVICPCQGKGLILEHSVPILYDLIDDPKELKPLINSFAKYQMLLDVFRDEFDKAESEWMPQSQLELPSQTLFRPWMQICANFPRCSQRYRDNS